MLSSFCVSEFVKDRHGVIGVRKQPANVIRTDKFCGAGDEIFHGFVLFDQVRIGQRDGALRKIDAERIRRSRSETMGSVDPVTTDLCVIPRNAELVCFVYPSTR